MEQTIYVIMCNQRLGHDFAWEAHFDRMRALERQKELAKQNGRSYFSVLKTKLVS
jgi:hypothetical protein